LTAASSASVTRVIAETTTTGDSSLCMAIIPEARSNASASPTEVPPNFITIGFVIVSIFYAYDNLPIVVVVEQN
jgi:hypothetical protein